MYADPYDSEDRAFPFGLAVTVVFISGGAILLWVSSIKPADPPVPPWPLRGCYSTPGGPDLLIEGSSITVLQVPSLKVHSSVKFIKGWAFETDRWLNFRRTAQGTIHIEPGSNNGEYLQISREGEFALPVPGFELIDDRSNLAIRYTRSGSECGTLSSPLD